MDDGGVAAAEEEEALTDSRLRALGPRSEEGLLECEFGIGEGE